MKSDVMTGWGEHPAAIFEPFDSDGLARVVGSIEFAAALSLLARLTHRSATALKKWSRS